LFYNPNLFYILKTFLHFVKATLVKSKNGQNSCHGSCLTDHGYCFRILKHIEAIAKKIDDGS